VVLTPGENDPADFDPAREISVGSKTVGRGAESEQSHAGKADTVAGLRVGCIL